MSSVAPVLHMPDIAEAPAFCTDLPASRTDREHRCSDNFPLHTQAPADDIVFYLTKRHGLAGPYAKVITAFSRHAEKLNNNASLTSRCIALPYIPGNKLPFSVPSGQNKEVHT